MMRKYDYALFDLDGTLTESAPAITKSVQYALSSVVGIDEPDLKKLETFVGPPLNTEFKRLYNFEDAVIDELVKTYRAHYAAGGMLSCELYPGVEEMLQSCQDAGIKLAVASSKPEIYVKQIMDHFGLSKYFEVICGSEMDDEMKKQTGIDNKAYVMGKAFDRLQADKTRSVMIGDRKFDIAGAKYHNVASVGVTFGYGDFEELSEAGATYLADTAKEVALLLTGIQDKPENADTNKTVNIEETDLSGENANA